MTRRTTCLIALAFAGASYLSAQTANPVQWYTGTASKVKPGMMDAYLKQMATLKKVYQSRKDAGEIKSWALYRVIAPTGASNEFDVVSMILWPKRAEIDPDVLAKMNAPHWQKVGMSQAQFGAQMREISTIVRTSVSVRHMDAGTFGVGDLIRVDYVKLEPGTMGEYINRLRTVYKPINEADIQGGTLKAWAMHSFVYPAGADRTADAYTIHAFSSSDQMFARGPGGAAAFAKVHPNVNYLETTNRQNEIRKLVRSVALKQIDGI
ncbi:MAG TPA: hypothetical protein DEH78_23570 [Solibacterales bacterium]|nr:hypothetical protein [Bryobacterales bacterium]